MKRLMAAALLLAFACAPSIARAATIDAAPAARAAIAEASGEQQGRAPAKAAPGDTADYAAREAAAPGLGNFRGGSVVVIGGGTVLVVLLIVLIVLVL